MAARYNRLRDYVNFNKFFKTSAGMYTFASVW